MADAQDDLRTQLQEVRDRIATSARRSDRTPEEITLVAVSKTHPASSVQEALNLGVIDFGENRVQEADPKIETVGRSAARWHLIGHLQANKARRAVKLFDWIHSLDSVSLAQRLDRACADERRAELSVLIQVDLAGEETKSGIEPAGLPELVETVKGCANLTLSGLMVLPPLFKDPEQVRPYFQRLRALRDELSEQGHFEGKRGELSMGMTHDFEVAIEEGATMVRIGTAIFGARESGE
jgi:pyridoxal phosphate enzyme (YggS family)